MTGIVEAAVPAGAGAAGGKLYCKEEGKPARMVHFVSQVFPRL